MIDLVMECKDAKKIGITGHIRPDGDCTGSTLALANYISNVNKEACVDVLLEEPSECFRILKGYDKILHEAVDENVYDVFFVLDSVPDRIGFAHGPFFYAKKTINIDHHISNLGGSCNLEYIVRNASSASECVYDLMDEKYMDEEIAKAIYLGIVHDTGVFQYSNTSPKTLRIAASLLEYGFDFSKLIDETYYEKTNVQTQILGRSLLESVLFLDGKCAVSVVTKKMMEFYGASNKDFEGIVSHLRNIKGVEVAIFIYEIENQTFKVSLRSCGAVNVAKIAEYFGGGGHVRAAGCNIAGTYHDVINNLSLHIEKQLEAEIIS